MRNKIIRIAILAMLTIFAALLLDTRPAFPQEIILRTPIHYHDYDPTLPMMSIQSSPAHTGDIIQGLDGLGNIGYRVTRFGNIVFNGVYQNFGTVEGFLGYGFRNNGGILECKNSGGTWRPCIGAPATVVDASLLAGADMCAKISAGWLALVTAGYKGGTVDARGFTGIQPCAGSMWTNYPWTPGTASTFSGTLLLSPSVILRTDVSQVSPSSSVLDGGSYEVETIASLPAPGAIIQPSNTFPVSTPILEMGADPGVGVTPPIGVQIKNLVVYCVKPSGSAPAGSISIRNQWSQENSIVENVELEDCATSQLDIENGGHLGGSQNSGPYTRIHAYSHGTAKCLTYGTLIPNSTQGIIKGFRDWTCSGSTTTDVAIDGSNVTLENFHVESPSVDAVAIGVTHAVKNVNVMGLDCLGNPGTNCVHIGATSNTINIVGIHSFQFTNLLQDDGNPQSGGTIPQATEAWLSLYSRGLTGIIESTSGVLTKTIGTAPVTAISGNTPTLASTTGSLTLGNFSSFDASGNVQDSGVSVNSCATAGRCAWWGSSIEEPQVTEATGTFADVTVANVFGFYLPMRTTVSTVGITTTAGDTAATCDVGIYDSTGAANSVGQLKFHVNGGWDCHTGSTTAAHALSVTGGGTGASLTIGPGYYFLAYCTSSTAVTFAGIHNAYQAVTNVSNRHMGTVASGCASGVLQAAPGAITYAGIAPIGAFFEP